MELQFRPDPAASTAAVAAAAATSVYPLMAFKRILLPVNMAKIGIHFSENNPTFP
jgi:hypothetical protein